jgi:hypothetical protein
LSGSDQKRRDDIQRFLIGADVKDIRWSESPEGGIVDWYCKSDTEREFGAKTYARSAEMAELFYLYKYTVQDGKGWEGQFMRRLHVLANQLGYNYREEGILLIKRGVLALLFWFLGHHKAVWVYTKILRQEY